MLDWNNLQPLDRLKEWKVFRNEISTKSDNKVLTEVAKHFATVPIGRRTVDYYEPSSWFSPWEILHGRYYCTSSISILMYHTIKMVTDMKVDMALIDDATDMYLMPVINETYCVNYILGEVSSWDEISKQVSVKQYYTEDEIKQIT